VNQTHPKLVQSTEKHSVTPIKYVMKIIISMMNLLVENIYTRNIHNMLSWVLIKNANCAHNDSYILLDMWYNLSTLLEFEVLVASLLYQRGFSLHYYTQMSRGKK
jgi:hypothetical protein